ncbi:antirestriction protein ArdA [Amorphus orientalis]
MDELADRWDDYSVYRGTAADYAEEIVSECYEIPGNLEAYIDYERLGRDMVLGGDIVELEHDLILIGGGAHLRVLPGMQIRIL